MSEIKPVNKNENSVTNNLSNKEQEQKMSWNADSVFNAIDKDNNGVISQEEAEQFGFSFLKNDNLTKEQFVEEFNAQEKKLSDNNTSLSDFKSCFDKSAGGVVKNVNLTPQQQKELLKRIEMFEAYKSTLSDNELIELEKNKHAQLDFAQFMDNGAIPDDYDFSDIYETYGLIGVEKTIKSNNRKFLRDSKVRKYKEYFGTNGKYEQIIKALQSGNLSKISNEDLGFILNHTDTSDLLQDGKIGSFTQGQRGDCWFLSQLNNYASTKEGAENIAKRITNNKNGTFTITFQNPFEQSKTIKYNISNKELEDFDLSRLGKNYSAGDKDVRIYEIAVAKMLSEYLPDTEENRNSGISSGDTVKRILVHKALGYTSNITTFSKGETLTNSVVNPMPEEDCQTWMYEYNSDDEIYSCEYTLAQDKNGKAIVKASKPKQIGYNNFANLIKGLNLKNSDLVANSQHKLYRPYDMNKSKFSWFIYDNIISKFSSDTKIDKARRYIQEGHVYNLENAENNSVTVNDPYLSSFPHSISNEEFEEQFGVLTYLPSEIKYPCK